MHNSNISFFLFKYAIIILISVYGCANPQPPSGGPPDTTPPELIEVFPENQTVNFDKRVVLLRFSKYMEKPKVIENFSISPNVQVKFNWSGKLLEIELPDDLDTSVTYSITLGTEYTDIYNNKPSQAFSLIFSAGSKIDSGFVTGKVYDNRPEGAYIWAYSISNVNPDTINPATTKPDYKVQLGSNGEFKIPALKEANYRIFSIRDQFKNDLYEPVDAFGTAVNDIMVVNSKSEPTILKIGTPQDKYGPSINDVNAKYSNYLSVNFSEPIDKNYVNNASFSITSENNSQKAEIISAAIHYENKSRVDIITSSALDTSIIWNLVCLPNSENTIRDTLGNLIVDSLNVYKFKANYEQDTTKIKFLFASIKDSSEFVPVRPSIDFIFDKPIDTSEARLEYKIIEYQSNKEFKFTQKVIGSIISLIPDEDLPDSKWFRIEAAMNQVKSFSNKFKIDTSLALDFKTIDYKVRGSISGTVQFDKEICDFTKYILLKNSNGRDILKSIVNDKNEWSFKNIETGDYTAEIFCDVNGDGVYSYGSLYPYKYAEPFVVFEEVFKIKARWELENIILRVKDTHVH